MLELDDETFCADAIQTLPRERLLQLQARVMAERDEVELQLQGAKSKARTEGVWAKPQWFSSSESKLRRKRRQLQWISVRLSELKKQAPDTHRNFFRDFHTVARATLPSDVFEALERKAKL